MPNRVLSERELLDPYAEAERVLGKTAAAFLRLIEFAPHPKQLEILAAIEQVILLGGAIHGGKSMVASVMTLLDYLRDLHRVQTAPGQPREYWVVGHRVEDTYYEWLYLNTYFTKLGIMGQKKSDPPQFTLNDGMGTVFKVKFSSDPSKLSGVAPLGILVCEAGNVLSSAFDYLLIRSGLRDVRMIIAGSLEENKQPWFTARYTEYLVPHDDMRAFPLRPADNLALFPDGDQSPKLQKIKGRVTEQSYAERIEGIPTTGKGLVYPEFDPLLHIMREYEYRPDQAVWIWQDPGYSHMNALLAVQYYGGVVHIFDEVHLNITTQAMIETVQARYWWANPNKRLVVDPYYATAHFSAQSMEEIWAEKTGLANEGIRHGIHEGINRVKSVFRPHPATGEAQIKVHIACRGLLSELGVVPKGPNMELQPYKFKILPDGRQLPNPVDANNDACDALRNGLFVLLGPVRDPYENAPSAHLGVSTAQSRNDYARALGWRPQDEIDSEHMGVSTPDTRGDYGGTVFHPGVPWWETLPGDRFQVSTPQSRGEVFRW